MNALAEPIGGADGFARTIDAMALPCLVTDGARGCKGPLVLLINRAFEELCGYAAAEVCGHSPTIMYGPDTDVLALQKYFDQMRATGKAFTDLVSYRKDGSPYEALLLGCRVGPQTDFGKDSGVLYVSFSFQLGDASFCLPQPPNTSLN